MKIATVTLNPAIDQTVTVNDFQVGTVNRSLGMRLDAGGKGVNVALFLADYGVDVTVTGFLGEENAGVFERSFETKGIEDCFIRVPGETRINIKIQDEATQLTTDLNTAGQASGKYALDKLNQQIQELAKVCDWIILSGNLPLGLSSNYYAELIESIKGEKSAIVLDTSGEALREGIKANPWIVKPNVDELSELTGKSFNSISEIYSAGHSLLNRNLQLVIVSMGADGALFIRDEETLLATPPTVSLKSSVGAGDALVAGLLAGFSKKLPFEKCVQLATAFSLSAITRLERKLPPLTELENYIKQVTVSKFEIQQAP